MEVPFLMRERPSLSFYLKKTFWLDKVHLLVHSGKYWKQLLLFSLLFLEEIMEQGLQNFCGLLSFFLLETGGASY